MARGKLSDRLNAWLGRFLPERRIFVKSDTETRFVRLRPVSQAVGLAGAALLLGWSIVASAILALDNLSSGSLRALVQRDKAQYEARLSALAAERDARAAAARDAEARFALALARISEMQTELLAAEERARELETGIEVIQGTLRRTITERDAARAERRALLAAAGAGAGATQVGELRDLQATVEFLAMAVAQAAEERDAYAAMALQARKEAEHLALERKIQERRTELILARLEEAVATAMQPLERMFRTAGLSPSAILDEMRRSRAGQDAPLAPLSRSTRGTPAAEETRAEAVLEGLEKLNLYRLATQRMPFAEPVRAAVRFTSGFGVRRDPKTGRARMHNGLDFAGPRGTPIYATGDGTVAEAGWHSGYGYRVLIEHDFGLSTLYAHLTRIHVREGQRVSRGERIGDMGSTGRSTGTHLHYEVHVEGRPVNPMTYIRAANDVF